MKVDNPRFGLGNYEGEVTCSDCPLAGKGHLCHKFMESHRFSEAEPGACPTAETYAEACELAEKEAQK